MRELNKIQTAIFLFGGILMAVGAGTTLLGWASAPYIYALGALGFASMQMLQRYEGSNFTIRRLRRMMLISDVLFLVAAVLMFANKSNILGLSYITYIEYVYNKWVVVLLIAALLQLYSMHRIGSEGKKIIKRLRICFKMRKIIFIPQYIVVISRPKTIDYEQDILRITNSSNICIVR